MSICGLFLSNSIPRTNFNLAFHTLPTKKQGFSPLIVGSPKKGGVIKNGSSPTVCNVVDIDRLNNYVKSDDIEDVAVIGGGFIGVEVAENLRLAGFNVSLIAFSNQIMMPFDYDKLNSGKQVKAQAVVLAIGVRPETTLAKEAGLAIGELDGIQIDGNYVTSDPSIYAVGDAIEVFHQLTHSGNFLLNEDERDAANLLHPSC